MDTPVLYLRKFGNRGRKSIALNIRLFLVLLDRQALARRSSEFLLDFLKVIITATVCLGPVVEWLPDTRCVTQRWWRVGRSVGWALIG